MSSSESSQTSLSARQAYSNRSEDDSHHEQTTVNLPMGNMMVSLFVMVLNQSGGTGKQPFTQMSGSY